MRLETGADFTRNDATHVAPLELVVPVTTPRLTRGALGAAERLAAGIDARVRMIRIQIVPFPLPLAAPPVPVPFLRKQMEAYGSTLPISRELRIARDFNPALSGALHAGSIVILAAKKRPWRTRNERIADSLRRAGHTVLVTYPDLSGENHA